jgi:hypothetical protein
LGTELPATLAGQPKHIAVHTHHVKVGVTNNLKKLVGESTHIVHHAHGHQQVGHGLNSKGLAGQTVGIQHGEVQQTICNHVNHEKTGSHSSTFSQSQISFHINTGSFHGANGAQFNGEAKHEASPNQQLNQSIIS